jgi:hypothetical protein
MTRSTVVAAAILAFTLGSGAALAQNPPPPASAAPAASPPSSDTGAADKKAIAKSCTDQANAKGLHGKARKKFRSKCRKNGGKVE